MCEDCKYVHMIYQNCETIYYCRRYPESLLVGEKYLRKF